MKQLTILLCLILFPLFVLSQDYFKTEKYNFKIHFSTPDTTNEMYNKPGTQNFKVTGTGKEPEVNEFGTSANPVEHTEFNFQNGTVDVYVNYEASTPEALQKFLDKKIKAESFQMQLFGGEVEKDGIFFKGLDGIRLVNTHFTDSQYVQVRFFQYESLFYMLKVYNKGHSLSATNKEWLSSFGFIDPNGLHETLKKLKEKHAYQELRGKQ